MIPGGVLSMATVQYVHPYSDASSVYRPAISRAADVSRRARSLTTSVRIPDAKCREPPTRVEWPRGFMTE